MNRTQTSGLQQQSLRPWHPHHQIVRRVLGSVLAEHPLIGKNPNWTEVLGTVAATINLQHGRGKHKVFAFEVVYGKKHHHLFLCSKEEAYKC